MKVTLDLSGKTAFVTGGNVGIGRAISLALAEAGADVALTCFSHDGEPTADEVRAIGRKAIALRMDATMSEQVDRAMAEAASALGGKIDILVSNAGNLLGRVPVSDMSDEHWRSVMDVNITHTFFCTRAALRHMPDGGRIVNMSSIAAHNGGGPGAVAYASAKAAIIAFTRGMAKELAPRGITVNCVAPGLIVDTYFHKTYSTEETIKAAIAGIPLKRAGVPDDVAAVVVFLASGAAGFITGEVTEINGGAWFV